MRFVLDPETVHDYINDGFNPIKEIEYHEEADGQTVLNDDTDYCCQANKWLKDHYGYVIVETWTPECGLKCTKRITNISNFFQDMIANGLAISLNKTKNKYR